MKTNDKIYNLYHDFVKTYRFLENQTIHKIGIYIMDRTPLRRSVSFSADDIVIGDKFYNFAEDIFIDELAELYSGIATKIESFADTTPSVVGKLYDEDITFEAKKKAMKHYQEHYYDAQANITFWVKEFPYYFSKKFTPIMYRMFFTNQTNKELFESMVKYYYKEYEVFLKENTDMLKDNYMVFINENFKIVDKIYNKLEVKHLNTTKK